MACGCIINSSHLFRCDIHTSSIDVEATSIATEREGKKKFMCIQQREATVQSPFTMNLARKNKYLLNFMLANLAMLYAMSHIIFSKRFIALKLERMGVCAQSIVIN